MLNSFVLKLKLSRKEARRLETLSNFGIFPITLKIVKIRVSIDAFKRVPNDLGVDHDVSVNEVKVISIDIN